MIIKTVNTLDISTREQLLKLWNEEYPAALNYESLADFDAYLGKLIDPTHHLIISDRDQIEGWAFTFIREDERWFGVILDKHLQGKGFGSFILDHLKLKTNNLKGWVMAHSDAPKRDGTFYKSPLAFYRENGFAVFNDIQLNIGTLSMIKVSWKKTSPYITKRFNIPDTEQYKSMRLEALQIEPGMFGNSYAFEAAYPENYWPERLSNPAIATFGLYHEEDLIGITSIIPDKEKPDHAYMTQSYIRKEHRGKGLSRLLYEARITFARKRNIKWLTIGHKASNTASFAANQHFGFQFTHCEPRTWPDGTTEDMLYYKLEL